MRTSLLPTLLLAGWAAACTGSAPATSQPEATPDATSAEAPAGAPGAAPADASVPSASRGTGAAPLAPAAPPAPRYREVTLPAGTELPLRLETAVASDTSAVEDPVRASLRDTVVVDGATALPEGTELRGVVTGAERSGKVKGRAALSFRFTSLTLDDEQYAIRTSSVARQAQGTKKEDAAKIGIGAGAGAIVGGIVGGGKGAAVGSAIGGGAGTGVVLATRGDEVRLAVGTPVTVRLSEPLTLRVRLD